MLLENGQSSLTALFSSRIKEKKKSLTVYDFIREAPVALAPLRICQCFNMASLLLSVYNRGTGSQV